MRFKNLFIVWQYDSFKYRAMLLTELGRMKTLASFFYKETTNGGKSLVLAYLFSDFNDFNVGIKSLTCASNSKPSSLLSGFVDLNI